MAQMVILGSAAAIADENTENTFLAFQEDGEFVLVDCAGSSLPRLQKAGLNWQELNHIILTHFHADHVAGLPNLLVSMWLLGRKEPIKLHGLSETLERIQQMLELFGWRQMPGFFPIEFLTIPPEEMAPVLTTQDFKVFASPTQHVIPSIGLRIESKQSGQAIAYSGDTMPTDTVTRLAADAHVLVHESTGDSFGHSGPAQAAEIARKAGAGHLYLIHYLPSSIADPGAMTKEAFLVFQGPVTLAQDFMRVSF